jgi:hypothetical protein
MCNRCLLFFFILLMALNDLRVCCEQCDSSDSSNSQQQNTSCRDLQTVRAFAILAVIAAVVALVLQFVVRFGVADLLLMRLQLTLLFDRFRWH